MKSRFYADWRKNISITTPVNSKTYVINSKDFDGSSNRCYDFGTPIDWHAEFDIETMDWHITTSKRLPKVPDKLTYNKTFSERFRVFYGKDTYVLVDTENGLLAKVKKSKELIDDIEIAVLYLILKGFIGLKTSGINKLISTMDKPIKGCLYELADQYNVVANVNNGYFCTAIPRSSRRMVKCLIDNAECNSKEDSNSSFAKFAEILGIKGTQNKDLDEDIIAKYLNEVMKK